MPERVTVMNRREKSAEAVVAARRRAEGVEGFALRFSVDVESQMFPFGKLAMIAAKGEARLGLAARQSSQACCQPTNPRGFPGRFWDLTSTTSTARCGPACRVVWEGAGP